MRGFLINYGLCNGCKLPNQLICVRNALWCGLCLDKIVAESWLICKEYDCAENDLKEVPEKLRELIIELNCLFLGSRSGEKKPAPPWVFTHPKGCKPLAGAVCNGEA